MSCLDKISNVIVNSLAGDSPLVAIVNEELVFTPVVTSLGRTNYYTPVTYQWNFSNGHTEVFTNSEPSLTYSYSTPGLWNVTLRATNNVSSALFTGTVNVVTG